MYHHIKKLMYTVNFAYPFSRRLNPECRSFHTTNGGRSPRPLSHTRQDNKHIGYEGAA